MSQRIMVKQGQEILTCELKPSKTSPNITVLNLEAYTNFNLIISTWTP